MLVMRRGMAECLKFLLATAAAADIPTGHLLQPITSPPLQAEPEGLPPHADAGGAGGGVGAAAAEGLGLLQHWALMSRWARLPPLACTLCSTL